MKKLLLRTIILSSIFLTGCTNPLVKNNENIEIPNFVNKDIQDNLNIPIIDNSGNITTGKQEISGKSDILGEDFYKSMQSVTDLNEKITNQVNEEIDNINQQLTNQFKSFENEITSKLPKIENIYNISGNQQINEIQKNIKSFNEKITKDLNTITNKILSGALISGNYEIDMINLNMEIDKINNMIKNYEILSGENFIKNLIKEENKINSTMEQFKNILNNSGIAF